MLKEADAPFIDTTVQPRGPQTAVVTLNANAILPLAHRGKSSLRTQPTETMNNSVMSNGTGTSVSRKRTVAPGETCIREENPDNLPRVNKAPRLDSAPHSGLVIKEVIANDLFGTPIEIGAAQAAEAASDDMNPGIPSIAC